MQELIIYAYYLCVSLHIKNLPYSIVDNHLRNFTDFLPLNVELVNLAVMCKNWLFCVCIYSSVHLKLTCSLKTLYCFVIFADVVCSKIITVGINRNFEKVFLKPAKHIWK